ncbi:MAG: acylneuraminate cytidylyltransferase, partial [Planctomycetota bacterium]|nr:acylneuraminate cytidylyltransferase [Planctomycetota bacterium]
TGDIDNSRFRWTVDTTEDLDLVRQVHERLGSDGRFTLQDVLHLMGEEPGLVAINSQVEQKKLEED